MKWFSATNPNHAAGGRPPYNWGMASDNWMGIDLDLSTGVLSGYPFNTGTFHANLGLGDATGNGTVQHITITVKQCP